MMSWYKDGTVYVLNGVIYAFSLHTDVGCEWRWRRVVLFSSVSNIHHFTPHPGSVASSSPRRAHHDFLRGPVDVGVCDGDLGGGVQGGDPRQGGGGPRCLPGDASHLTSKTTWNLKRTTSFCTPSHGRVVPSLRKRSGGLRPAGGWHDHCEKFSSFFR